MPKIKEIKVTNNFILITLDDKRSFKISEDDYFEYKFKAETDLSDAEITNLERISNFHAAYMRALNRIKYKDRTEYEIRQTVYDEFKLIKPEVDKIINKLKRYDYINDKRYLLELVERSQMKFHGYNKIKDSLIQVRINSNLIEEYLIYDEEKDFELATLFATRSLKTIRNHNYSQTLNKLRSRLLYRGFNNGLITRVIEEINVAYNDSQEKDLLKKDFDKVFKRYQKQHENFELTSRVFNYLASRGYSYELINELLEEVERNNE